MEAKIKSITFYKSNGVVSSFYVLAEKDGKFAKFLLKKPFKDAHGMFEHNGNHKFTIDKDKRPVDTFYKGSNIKMYYALEITQAEKSDTELNEWEPFESI